MVVSTAPVNIEASSEAANLKFEQENPDLRKIDSLPNAMNEIINQLDLTQSEIEMVITVHGYNTSRNSVKDWYKDVYKYVNKDELLRRQKNKVFIGYRWPSETVKGDTETPIIPKLFGLIKALPVLPRYIFWVGLIGTSGFFTGLILNTNSSNWSRALLGLAVIIFSWLFATIFTMVLLRFSLYFRDSYRANQYGVPDLVELIRQIDKYLILHTPGQTEDEKMAFWNQKKIKLSFLGHSMGGFVVTSTVRILSDVFDNRSIGTTNLDNPEKHPGSEIGHVFKLGRLLLVSPDIPVDTILQGRSNFLSSSLRRFEEAYLFSNEGDLALRLASTAANYFSFPANTRHHGYRLGNLAVGSKAYGIINLDELQLLQPETLSLMAADDYLSNLEIGSSGKDKESLVKLQSRMGSECNLDSMHLARNFSFFDCTDYKDTTNYKNKTDQEIGVLSNALRKQNLSFWDYLVLTFQYFFLGKDVHGGYFRGDFTRDLMYSLLFVGIKDYASSLADNRNQKDITSDRIFNNGLEKINNKCQSKGIQALLSPTRTWMMD
ncbi:MAG: hypothetical protein OHK0017_06130 [Patescibacteria group bacterium]